MPRRSVPNPAPPRRHAHAGGEFLQPSPWLDFAIRSLAQFDDFVGASRPTAASTSSSATPVRPRSHSRTPSSNLLLNAPLSNGRLVFLRILTATNCARSFPWSIRRHRRRPTPTKPSSIPAPDDRPRAACLRRCGHRRGMRVRSIVSGTHSPVFLSNTAHRSAFAVLAAALERRFERTVNSQPCRSASFPMKGHLLGYRLPVGSLAATSGMITLRFSAPRRTHIAGSSSEDVGYDRTIDPEIVSGIAARAAALVPALEPSSRIAWIGFRPPPTQPPHRTPGL